MNNQQQSPTPAQSEALQVARESIEAEGTGHMEGADYYWRDRYRRDLDRILRAFGARGGQS